MLYCETRKQFRLTPQREEFAIYIFQFLHFMDRRHPRFLVNLPYVIKNINDLQLIIEKIIIRFYGNI